MRFEVVEKKNPLALHCICETRERAEHWIQATAPVYVARGYFSDKALTVESFTIVESRKVEK